MSRPLRTSSALCLFAACGGGDPQPDVKAEGSEPQPTESVERACRVEKLQKLARALADATPVERRAAVAQGLRSACDVPPSYVAFLDATERSARREARFEAAAQATDLLDGLCANPEELPSALGPMKPGERSAALFDRCGLGDKGLIEREAWLRWGPSSVVPFAARDWLEAQGATTDDAVVVAQALLLRDRKRWSSPEQKLPMVDGEMEAVPADAILLELGLTELRLGGAHVLPLDEGRGPTKPAAGEDDPVTMKLREALLAERETLPEDTSVTLAIAADAGVPSSSIVWVAALSKDAKIDVVGLVARSALLEDGFFHISSPSGATPGSATLRIDAEGFHLRSPSGKTDNIPAPYDFDALDAKLRALEDAAADTLPLRVEAAAELPAGVFVNVLAWLEQPGCDEHNPCRDIDVRLRDSQRGEAEAIAMRSGLLGILAAEDGHPFASSFGDGLAGAFDDEDRGGGLVGTELGEAFERGGLGAGSGAGGTAEGMIGVGEGSLDKDAIRRTARAHVSEVRHCYNKFLRTDPSLEGKVVVDFTIGGDGKVTASSVTSTTMTNKAVGTCIAGAVKGWKFPSPSGGGVVSVTYPFLLTAG